MKRTKVPEKKRKRTKFRRIVAEIVICSSAKTCWYKGNCPHKEKHQRSKFCKTDFCSQMKLKGCYCEKV